MLGQRSVQILPSFLMTVKPWIGYLTSVSLVVRVEYSKAFYTQPGTWLRVRIPQAGLTVDKLEECATTKAEPFPETPHPISLVFG